MKFFLRSCVLLFSFSVVAQDPPRFVQTHEELRQHIQLHRQRVLVLGEHLYERFPEFFRELDPQSVKRGLELHDSHKINEPILNQLKQLYGKPITAADKEIIGALNQMDGAETKKVIAPHLLEMFLRLERIADFVDRGLDPVAREEFGRNMKRASDFLKDPQDRMMARYLEAKYTTLTKNLAFPSKRVQPHSCFYTMKNILH